MENTKVEYQVKVFTDRGWEVLEVPKAVVTRTDHRKFVSRLAAQGYDANLYSITTTVRTMLILSTLDDES